MCQHLYKLSNQKHTLSCLIITLFNAYRYGCLVEGELLCHLVSLLSSHPLISLALVAVQTLMLNIFGLPFISLGISTSIDKELKYALSNTNKLQPAVYGMWNLLVTPHNNKLKFQHCMVLSSVADGAFS